jgi:hypothetical protein
MWTDLSFARPLRQAERKHLVIKEEPEGSKWLLRFAGQILQ